MADLAAVGLASSIITFIDFSIEFGNLMRDVAQAHGQLPKELEECREYIGVIATWLQDIKRTLPPGPTAEKEDTHLEAATQRCTKTSSDLIALLESLCGSTTPDPNTSIVRKTRSTLGSMKRAGKIMWKREQITDLRDKLQDDRDNVHAHIANRTGMQAKKIL
jgi:hypothetical protein